MQPVPGYAARNLSKHALLSTVVIATLTLGIGAGVFKLINAVAFRAQWTKTTTRQAFFLN